MQRSAARASHWINLAAAFRHLGDGEKERRALDQALAIDQTDLLALVRMAELHERLGEATPAAERWSAVLAIAAGIKDPSPEFAEILGHAKDYVAEQQQKLVAAVDSALAGDLARATIAMRAGRGPPPTPGLASDGSTQTSAKACITRSCPPTSSSTASFSVAR